MYFDYIDRGDCLELMREISDHSIDMILCDLPYGFTDCHWDSIIPYDKLWAQYRRVLKYNGNCVLFSNEPFTSSLVQSNAIEYSHKWYWIKNNVTAALLAKQQPMRCVEDINVFILNKPRSNNAMMFKHLRDYLNCERKKSGLSKKEINNLLGNTTSSHYFTYGNQFHLPTLENYMKLQSTGFFSKPYKEIYTEYENEVTGVPTYNPQGLVPITPKINRNTDGRKSIYHSKKNDSVQNFTNYPKNTLYFNREKKIVHPTQKPIALLEYLIKTYSNENEIVLDNCMGSGSTCVAAVNTNRHYIGFELNESYYDIACKRLDEVEGIV